jgi:hypothetical protein
MDVDFIDGYGSHDFTERAQKRQRLDNDPIPAGASELLASTIEQPDSWHQSVNGNNQLLLEDLWTPGFHDAQNDPLNWCSPIQEVVSYSGGGGYQREQSYNSSNLPRLQVLSPVETQQNYHSPITEESNDVEVEEEVDGDASTEQEYDGLLCFGMVSLKLTYC